MPFKDTGLSKTAGAHVYLEDEEAGLVALVENREVRGVELNEERRDQLEGVPEYQLRALK